MQTGAATKPKGGRILADCIWPDLNVRSRRASVQRSVAEVSFSSGADFSVAG